MESLSTAERLNIIAQATKSNKVSRSYKQHYRKAWEQVPEFKEWIAPYSGSTSKAYCKICNKLLYAHRLSLTKHVVSRRHMWLAQKKVQEESNENEEGGWYGLVSANQPEDGEIEKRGGKKRHVFMKKELVEVVEGIESLEGEVLEMSEVVGGEEGLEGGEEVETMETTIDEEAEVYSEDEDELLSDEEDEEEGEVQSPRNVRTSLAIAEARRSGCSSNLTTQVLDISKGLPVPGLALSLYQLVDGRWTLVTDSQTNGDGRCAELGPPTGIRPGRYKLHYDTERYFMLRHQPTFYPFVEIVFDVCSPTEKYHIPLVLGPYGYTTYKGS